jgi:hypothetical protein
LRKTIHQFERTAHGCRYIRIGFAFKSDMAVADLNKKRRTGSCPATSDCGVCQWNGAEYASRNHKQGAGASGRDALQGAAPRLFDRFGHLQSPDDSEGWTAQSGDLFPIVRIWCFAAAA